MYSLNNFYYILYSHLLKPAKLLDVSFYPFGKTDPGSLIAGGVSGAWHIDKPAKFGICFFYDQEPLDINVVDRLTTLNASPLRFNILAHSEHSTEINTIQKKHFISHNWYYFFHGFAALDWYRDIEYFASTKPNFNKTYICLNRLCTEKRSYRLALVAELIKEKISNKGNVSLHIKNSDNTLTVKDEIFNPNSLLSLNAKKNIARHIIPLKENLIVDKEIVHGYDSANFGRWEYKMLQDNFWQVVTETVFYDQKLHLTEKIFKPIVTKRPFLLVAAPGNLAYFKSYGFKTFDRWINETYDTVIDNDTRISMIVQELKKLSALSKEQQQDMFDQMQEVLEYNFQHFYGKFKEIIVSELVDNFKGCVTAYNYQRLDDKAIDQSLYNWDSIKKLLSK